MNHKKMAEAGKLVILARGRIMQNSMSAHFPPCIANFGKLTLSVSRTAVLIAK